MKQFVSRNPKRKPDLHPSDNELDDRYASRRRIVELTSAPNAVVAEALSTLIDGYGTVAPSSMWSPRGKTSSSPIRLDESQGFLKNPSHKTALHDWWIGDEKDEDVAGVQRRMYGASRTPARMPIFDLMSTLENDGMLLVSAAAHIGELNSDHSHQREKTILPQIKRALEEASAGWNQMLTAHADSFGFKLSHRVKLSTDSHYRLSWHFALAWKLAQLGVPVVLLYLGFLDATELEPDGRLTFTDHAMWEKCVFEKTSKPLPEEIWDAEFQVPNGAKISVLRRTMLLDLPEENSKVMRRQMH